MRLDAAEMRDHRTYVVGIQAVDRIAVGVGSRGVAQFVNGAVKERCQFHQLVAVNYIRPRLVFLNLLTGDCERIAYLLLREPPEKPAVANVSADDCSDVRSFHSDLL